MTPQREYTVHVATTASAATEEHLEVIRGYLEQQVYGPVVSLDPADGTLGLTCQVPTTSALAAANLGWQQLMDACAAAQVTTKGVLAEVVEAGPYVAPAQ